MSYKYLVDTNLAESGLRERGKLRRTAQILDAARELLREGPASELTVERIAARAEVSQPTVFNLVGRREHIWSRLADESLGQLDFPAFDRLPDPEHRARAIVAAMINMVCDDGPVFRAVLAHWPQTARLIHNDPTNALTACFAHLHGFNAHRIAQLVAAGVIGVMHQWAADLITDDEARARGDDLVSLALLQFTSTTTKG